MKGNMGNENYHEVELEVENEMNINNPSLHGKYNRQPYAAMGFTCKEDYEAHMRRMNPRYKGEMAKDNAPYKKKMESDTMPKGMDYSGKGEY